MAAKVLAYYARELNVAMCDNYQSVFLSRRAKGVKYTRGEGVGERLGERSEECEKKETVEGSLREAQPPSFYERNFISLLFLHNDDIV